MADLAETIAEGRRLIAANKGKHGYCTMDPGPHAALRMLPALLDVAEAAAALRHKMREVYADSRYMNVWATAQERLGPYSGPDWIAESAALDSALAARGGE